MRNNYAPRVPKDVSWPSHMVSSLFRKLDSSGDCSLHQPLAPPVFSQRGGPAEARTVFKRQATEFNMRPLLSSLVFDRSSCPARVHGNPQRLAGLERQRGRGDDVQSLSRLGVAPRVGGSASGAEGLKLGNPHLPATGQDLRDCLEHGIDGVPDYCPSDSGPAGHTPGDVRFVHPFSPCFAALSERPRGPTDYSWG